MMTNMALFIDESKDQFEACKSLIEVERQVIGMPVVPNKVCICCCWRCGRPFAHMRICVSSHSSQPSDGSSRRAT